LVIEDENENEAEDRFLHSSRELIMANAIDIDGIKVSGSVTEDFSKILTPEALSFVGTLAREFDSRRKALLERRMTVQAEIDNGKMPDFLPETREIRESDWKIASVPLDLQDRRVEITGPVDRKMVINALNSDAVMPLTEPSILKVPRANSTVWPMRLPRCSSGPGACT
jgi:malate synthase